MMCVECVECVELDWILFMNAFCLDRIGIDRGSMWILFRIPTNTNKATREGFSLHCIECSVHP